MSWWYDWDYPRRAFNMDTVLFIDIYHFPSPRTDVEVRLFYSTDSFIPAAWFDTDDEALEWIESTSGKNVVHMPPAP